MIYIKLYVLNTLQINILEKRKTALEVQEEQLSIENERLQSLVTKQSEELENYQKGSLTQDQTANLLQELKTLEEKLQNAQENKSFFKEQWAKAVREIHRIKMEHQQAIQIQIKNSKEELQNLEYVHYIVKILKSFKKYFLLFFLSSFYFQPRRNIMCRYYCFDK